MPRHATLTDAAARRFKSPSTGQVDHFDAAFPGLSLRVTAQGRKTLTYLYRHAGKQKRITFGLYPAMSLAEARDKWRGARVMLQAGKDPARQDGAGSTNFASVAAEWLRRDQDGNPHRQDYRPHACA